MTPQSAARALMQRLVPHGDWEGAIAAFLAGYAEQCTAEMREKLDRALVASESHNAARARAINAAQDALVALERCRDAFMRCGELDAAGYANQCVARIQEMCREK